MSFKNGKITCNVCGKTFDMFDEENGYWVEDTLGYPSEFDGEHVSMHICVDCMDKIIKVCSVSPISSTIELDTCGRGECYRR